MKNKKTITYNDFGFPITLIDVPIKMFMGEEVLDIDMHKLQVDVLKYLISKLTPLTGPQLRFIRSFFELSAQDFAKKLGVTHPTIFAWEKEKAPIPATSDMCIRLEAFKAIQDEDIRKFINQVTVESIATHTEEQEEEIEIAY